MSVGRKLLSKWVAGAFQAIANTGAVSSLTGLDCSSNVAFSQDVSISHQLTGAARWTGVSTIAGGDNSVVISTGAIVADRPVFLTNYKSQNPASATVLSVDSVVDGISFAIRARSTVDSANPVGWMVVR